MNHYAGIPFSSDIEAHIAAGMLQDHGIAAIVESNHMSTLYGSGSTWSPVLVMVPEASYADALTLLKSHHDGAF